MNYKIIKKAIIEGMASVINLSYPTYSPQKYNYNEFEAIGKDFSQVGSYICNAIRNYQINKDSWTVLESKK